MSISTEAARYHDCCFYQKGASFVWASPAEKSWAEIFDILGVDSITLALYTACAVGTECYTDLLQLINRNPRRARTEAIRAILSANNVLLQRLHVYEGEFLEEQLDQHDRVQSAKLWRFDKQAAVYRDAEARLVAAVEGVEAKTAARLSRWTNGILFTFTAASLYSILGDILVLATDGSPVIPKLSLRTTLMACLTAGIVTLMALLGLMHARK